MVNIPLALLRSANNLRRLFLNFVFMNKHFFAAATFALLSTTGCSDATSTNAAETASDQLDTATAVRSTTTPTATITHDYDQFIPEGYVPNDTTFGDLNKDGVDDCVLIIKGTDPAKVVQDESGEAIDRNRRGIVVLFRKQNGYEVASKNYDCFSSEFEDGGVYYPPELYVEIEKGNLYVRYLHGRYGYWAYTFRYQNSDFELIGYDASSSNGPVVQYETSINYSTGKKIEKENTNELAESGEEVFKETISKISVTQLLKLSAIKDFDELALASEN